MNRQQEFRLRELGLGELALRSILWTDGEDHPYIVIEDGRPRVNEDEMIKAARAGLHLLVQSESDFDFASIAGALPFFQGIDVRQGGGDIVGWQHIGEATALTTFHGFDVQTNIDLSQLPNLQSVWVIGNCCWSAAQNPNLLELSVDDARLPTEFRLDCRLKKLVLDGVSGVRDLSFIGDVSDLKHVGLVKLAAVDVSALDGANSLQSLYIHGVKTVYGIEVLSNLMALRSLTLNGLRRADGLSRVRELRLDSFNADPNYLFDDATSNAFVDSHARPEGVGRVRRQPE